MREQLAREKKICIISQKGCREYKKNSHCQYFWTKIVKFPDFSLTFFNIIQNFPDHFP